MLNALETITARTWHRSYDDPESSLAWRLGVVRKRIAAVLDSRPGPLTALSLCSGDGRDLIGVLSSRADARRVSATLIDIDGQIAASARTAAATAHLDGVVVRTADAGTTASMTDVAPADLVLLIGIFGNIDGPDLRTTIAASPGLCRPGATLVWSRGRRCSTRAAVPSGS